MSENFPMLVVGIVGLITTIFGIWELIIQSKWDTIDALIIDTEWRRSRYRSSGKRRYTRQAVIEYTYKDEFHSGVRLDHCQINWWKGKTIKIKVNPNNPSKIGTTGNTISIIAFGLLFASFIAVYFVRYFTT